MVYVVHDDLIAPDNYNIVMEIEKHAKNDGKIALKYIDETGFNKEITYDQLIKNVNKTGNAFLEKGLQKGDKLLVMVPRIVEAYEVYLAALKTGIIIIPSSEMLTTEDLQYRVAHGEVDGVVSYYPYTHVYERIKEYDNLKKFSIGEQVANWHFLDDFKKTASDKFILPEDIHKDDIAFLPY